MAPIVRALGPGAVPKIDSDAFIADGAIIVGDVSVAAGASIWYGAVLRAEDAPIHIGRDCNVQDGVIIHTDPGEPTVLAEQVSVGHGAVIHGSRIGAGVLIGIRATVLHGCVVGESSFVAAGALVPPRTEIPAGALAIGVPASIREDVDDDKRAMALQAVTEYQRLSELHAAAQDPEWPSRD